VNSEEWEEGRNKEAEGLVPGVGSWVLKRAPRVGYGYRSLGAGGMHLVSASTYCVQFPHDNQSRQTQKLGR